ncbi:UAY_EMENI Positive regulator of purine utilization [Aspergillus nidulans FGSC A4]|uniref:Positive regulator of purine utilization n=1 Tax=Emericella nidulans (strain FGSC A4 / ATCC 38163 / CBS 112.46 / NRRL 194 / M139) TaxID=227321 RepID=UAY_EMENI|nr:transcription factor uaY [Aspergillus nidulans FGSC A4]P49413.2 RecName: Full=Positive regulator of purine utilization [Aspergillus nidulans FGSC A4]EAA65920.1 UAY_EMENI Positive regulator of purine utilization [Aspergillus nidulans FGSC A4]CBF88580.1 TPA: Positive regulator of purine utilization [Source:UniProtKB/Swiss-Prot;Acc:P49413] [Aspergillus nidulans FGSC A4]|eukprot:XP_658495.1 UAY_EMENI Positive regulator of purine utilization [Aspergillus nidulans FGSC A4]
MLNPSTSDIHTSPTAVGNGRKRPHPIADSGSAMPSDPSAQQLPHPANESAAIPSIASSSSFRNVSACNRCRQRKNRCDQRLPRCQACEKAGVRCVGYDPITKREIPRSYVYFLESRVAYLEKVLMDNGIEYNEAVAFDEEEAVKIEAGYEAYAGSANGPAAGEIAAQDGSNDKSVRIKKEKNGPLGLEKASRYDHDPEVKQDSDAEDGWRIQNLVSNIGMVSVQGTSDPRYLGSTSGISFARVVFAAVKSSVPGNSSERGPSRPKERLPHSATGTEGSTTRDSFFGLQTRPMMKCAAFPDRELAERLADLYFEHANPQIPIVHRVDFMELLDRTYSVDEKSRSPRSLYFLNIVFAIGSGIIFEDKPAEDQKEGRDHSPSATKRQRLSSRQYQPEEYHASAIVHLESFLSTSPTTDGFGALEELQAVLLLASFALLRPVAPGLWYIVGVAMRLAVDLGLHYEDGAGIDGPENDNMNRTNNKDGEKAKLRIDDHERGRREWVRDFRRRLWWCCYSFDRLVSCCVGRPFGISDQAISTEFPSILEDKYITKSGIIKAPEGAPSYKHSAFHYFKLRVLQSEIQDVLQHQQARFARQRGPPGARSFMRLDVVSPFLQGFDSFRSWRRDVDRRLLEWKNSAPMPSENGVRFPLEFLELNYWQAVIMLYQQSLTVPAELADELSPAEDVSSPSFSQVEEDEHDIYYKVAEAGQKVIRIYRQMHRVRLVNYTYLATHHIFMAGISFLYAIWHSPYVRSRLTLDEVDFTVLAATSVLRDLMHKCPPAEACRDAFERMSKATVEMSLSTTGFGPQVELNRVQTSTSGSRQFNATQSRSRPYSRQQAEQRQRQSASRRQLQMRQSRPLPRFDMNLEDLFGDNRAVAERQGSGGMGKLAQPYPVSETSDPNFARPQSHRNPSMEYYGPFENPVSPQQPQPQPRYYYNNSPQQSGSPGSVVAASGIPPYQVTPTEQENPSGMGLDYLDYDPTGIERQLSLGSEENSDFKFQGGAQSLGHGAGHNFGIDLGFGMAVDFQHDWSENANYDLLEGYFFGGAGATGPGHGHGHGSGI